MEEENPSDGSLDITSIRITQLIRALTLAQIVSILSLVVAITGGAFSVGMYAEKFNRPNNESELSDLRTKLTDREKELVSLASLKLDYVKSKERLKNLESKVQFLSVSAATHFHAMNAGENLYESRTDIDPAIAAKELARTTQTYKKLVDKLVGDDVGSVLISRSAERAFVFEYDQSKWALPDSLNW